MLQSSLEIGRSLGTLTCAHLRSMVALTLGASQARPPLHEASKVLVSDSALQTLPICYLERHLEWLKVIT